MYPYSFYPVYDDEYEQYVRAQQAQQARQRRQAYEQQQYLDYLRQQQYFEQQQRARAYREFQLREQERQQRVAREREAKRQRQLQARLDAERRRQQQAEHSRKCQQAAQQRRFLAQQQREQALREQFVNRHDDDPITLSLFDVLDHIQRQQQDQERRETSRRQNKPQIRGETDDDDDALSLHDNDPLQEGVETFDGYDAEPVDAPTVYFETLDPRVSEPPSPPVELVDDDLASAMRSASLEPNEKSTKAKQDTEAGKQQQQKKNQENNEKNIGILRTIKPRLDLELERFQGIISKDASDGDSARLKLRNLKEAHLRVEAIYEQLDELKVSRKLRSQKHGLTSTAVQLADKVDDAIDETQEQVAKFPKASTQSDSNSSAGVSTSAASAVSASPASTSSPAKHHVTIEDVDE